MNAERSVSIAVTSLVLLAGLLLTSWGPTLAGYGARNAAYLATARQVAALSGRPLFPAQQTLELLSLARAHTGSSPSLEFVVGLALSVNSAEAAFQHWGQHPGTAPILRNLGLAATQQEDHAAALEWYAQGAAADPSWAEPWHLIGKSNSALGEAYAAVAAHQQAVVLAPHQRGYWYALAQAQEAIEDWPGAVESLQRALSAEGPHPAPAVLYFQLGLDQQTRLEPAQKAEALRNYDLALAAVDAGSQPQLAARIHRQRGRIFADQARWNEAIAEFQEALSLASDDWTMYWTMLDLARAHKTLENQHQAINVLRDAIDLIPNQKQAYRLLAEYLVEAGDIVPARQLYRSILTLDPNDRAAAKAFADLENNNRPQ